MAGSMVSALSHSPMVQRSKLIGSKPTLKVKVKYFTQMAISSTANIVCHKSMERACTFGAATIQSMKANLRKTHWKERQKYFSHQMSTFLAVSEMENGMDREIMSMKMVIHLMVSGRMIRSSLVTIRSRMGTSFKVSSRTISLISVCLSMGMGKYTKANLGMGTGMGSVVIETSMEKSFVKGIGKTITSFHQGNEFYLKDLDFFHILFPKSNFSNKMK